MTSPSERRSRATRTIINMMILNDQRTNNINYLNYIMNVPFKLVDGSVIHHYAIGKNVPLPVVLNNLTQAVREDFRLNHFDIVPFGARCESGDEINKCLNRRYSNIHNVEAYEYFSKCTSFYIRPIVDFANNVIPIETFHSQTIEINDCPVCLGQTHDTRMNKYFNCDHMLCVNCFEQWHLRRGSNTNCPLCRSEFLN